MKKWLGIALLLICLTACSKPAEARGGSYNPCDTGLKYILNECHIVEHPAHPSEPKRSTEVGVGIDLILYENSVYDINYRITGEYKYDWNNGEQSAYAVVTMELMNIINKIKGLLPFGG
jgi:hypothetical protein